MSDALSVEGASAPDVRLYDDSGMPWQPVSPRLVSARLVILACVLAPPLVIGVALAVLVWPGFWTAVALVLLTGAVGTWVVVRQVPALSWIELEDELVVRRGRLNRSLVSVPYGRLQYVDVQSGPLDRVLGLAEVALHTASPHLTADIPGLSLAEAEALRQRLVARGESQRAGL